MPVALTIASVREGGGDSLNRREVFSLFPLPCLRSRSAPPPVILYVDLPFLTSISARKCSIIFQVYLDKGHIKDDYKFSLFKFV